MWWVAAIPTFLGAVAAIAVTQTPGRFDGVWAVTLDCPGAVDGARPFTYQFQAEVRGSVMHGEYGVKGEPGSMSLDGSLLPDGSASLKASGFTGRAEFNVNHTVRGLPYEHTVTARFDDNHGGGQWVTGRICTFVFIRH